ncbi:MAG: chromosome segregation protein SMC [Candidatus Azotimanducaceae bacterium]|uniref:Chromosome partition protein Smc n=1 Tax=OM182 bacterium TaxID=2510334 RepID=A0A520RZL1_9GAMM|nr:MAG: chromosome segregation protein SMC [OM182 bacterium]
MRLQAIKLSGFKSFVDPTTVPFPSNLCAVVGPNGCGKSNIIDAVRWVMGESSAKTLRGESMADVIFNGSTARKPVGQASIELQFDNSDGRLVGEYAEYSEISIKRQVGRDGQSNYFLNGVKCRRKDITDIFLGTGLGPRSYSIIEQGMISQLIEAKPEDLRVYLEEAAGISKYKERRRETERRIRHTRDNLDRLTDLREELERNLHYLEGQANAAVRYKEYRQEEREIRAELHVIRWSSIGEEAKVVNETIDRFTTIREATVADQRRLDAELEKLRDELVDLEEMRDQIQQQYYSFGTEIARLEDGIQYQNERVEQLHVDMEQVSLDLSKVEIDLTGDVKAVAELTHELKETQPKHLRLRGLEELSGEDLLSAQKDMETWQRSWDAFNQGAAESRQKSGVQQSRIEHLEQSIQRQNDRMKSLRDDVDRMSQAADEQEIEPLETMLGAQKEQMQRIEVELENITGHIERQREGNARQGEELDKRRSDLQLMLGRKASLEALQQAALGQSDDSESAWLTSHGLGENLRLVEQITVEDEWVLAVETVLGESLQSVCLPNLDDVDHLLTDFSKGSVKLISSELPVHVPEDRLASHVGGNIDVSNLLHGIYTAESLNDALYRRFRLSEGESIITKDGIWVGKNWVRVHKDPDEEESVIRRQAELDRLNVETQKLKESVDDGATELDSNFMALTQAEADRDLVHTRLAKQQEMFSETRAQLGAKRFQVEQLKEDIYRAEQDMLFCEDETKLDKDSLLQAKNELQIASDKIEEDISLKLKLSDARETIQVRFDEAQEKAETHRESAHELALKVESLETQIASAKRGMVRLTDQKMALEQKHDELSSNIKDSELPQKNMREELDGYLAKRLEVEKELARVRRESEAIDYRLRDLEKERNQLDQTLDINRAKLEEARLNYQTLEVRRTSIQEQMTEDRMDLDSVLQKLPELANETEWENKLRLVGNRIQKLGNPNLAAIDDFKVQSERKHYLDAQNDDLEKALITLENAIRKIDVETRARFKETFDQVNKKLQQLFPKLFGGGQAYLEMTGDDLLNTGVGLMARPPGKRNSSIHLLSGGEKALTAIALVFSIFSLNPAPFCLLDEVDAPLDDANVGRYSELVKEMSRTVQFIYITHNKIAMEMGEQLMGVTMHEPGVSRLVSVNMDEAVAMAAV